MRESVLDRGEAMLAGDRGCFPSQTAGLAAPLHVGAPGKALLAYLPLAELEALLATLPLLALTPHTVTDREQLLEELATVRQRGYAIRIVGNRRERFRSG